MSEKQEYDLAAICLTFAGVILFCVIIGSWFNEYLVKWIMR